MRSRAPPAATTPRPRCSTKSRRGCWSRSTTSRDREPQTRARPGLRPRPRRRGDAPALAARARARARPRAADAAAANGVGEAVPMVVAQTGRPHVRRRARAAARRQQRRRAVLQPVPAMGRGPAGGRSPGSGACSGRAGCCCCRVSVPTRCTNCATRSPQADAAPHVSPFAIDRAGRRRADARGLPQSGARSRAMTTHYADLPALMRELRAIGATNALRSRRSTLTGKSRFARAARRLRSRASRRRRPAASELGNHHRDGLGAGSGRADPRSRRRDRAVPRRPHPDPPALTGSASGGKRVRRP